MTDAGFKPQKEINRLKTLIRKLERDKDKMYPELGRLTYGEFLEGRLSDPALGEYCERLKAIDAQVGEAHAQIAGLQAQVQQMKAGPPPPQPAVAAACPSCGVAVTPGLKFCGNCGAEMAVGAPASGGSPSCPSCGKPVAPGTRFCGECGQPMPAVPAPAPAPPPARAAAPQPVPAPAPPPPPATVPTPAPPPPPPPATAPSTAQAAPGEPGKCPSCGALVEEEGAAFCGECGARIA